MTTNTIKVNVVVYNLNTENKAELREYDGMCKMLKGWGYSCFATYDTMRYADRQKFYKNIAGAQEIETDYLFENQFNTVSGYIVFEWSQPILANKYIKKGYYIEFSNELKQAKDGQYVCGYCGARYIRPEQIFCDRCLSSQYLQEDQLHLLELRPVSEGLGAKRGKDIPETLAAAYKAGREQLRERLIEEKAKQRVEKIEKLKSNLDRDIKNMIIETERKIEVLSKGYDIENMIHYTDKNNTATFGWRESIKDNAAECDKIKGLNLSFPYTIK
jgi:hypothetical protein